jgi:hypothetical protein
MSFFDNEVIKQLSQNPRWTVNIDNKCPVDIKRIKTHGQIRGARDKQCLTTLPDLLDLMGKVNVIPEAFVYFLDAERDNVVVLDIEKTCPDDIKTDLLNLDFLYGDISMSGNGRHLIFPCPPLNDITRNKRVMRRPDGFYEILLNHYVTFTQNLIYPTVIPAEKPFQQVWDELAATQKLITTSDIDVNTENRPKFTSATHRRFHAELIRAFEYRFTKTPADYHNDMSRYEFAVICAVKNYCKQFLTYSTFENIKLNENEQIWMVCDVIHKILPHRPKHDEQRNGQPFLFYQVCQSFAISDNS